MNVAFQHSYSISSWADFLAAPWWLELIVVFVTVIIVGTVAWGIGNAFVLPVVRKINFLGHTVTGTAQVLAVRSTGTVIDNTGYVCKIALRVEVPGREPYDVKVREVLDVTAMPAIQPGTTVPVRVVAAHPRRVRIDWNRPAAPRAQSWESSDDADMDQRSKIAYLHDSGRITDAEFQDIERAHATKDAYARHQMRVGASGSVPQAADLLASGQRVPGVLMSFAANGDDADSAYSRAELRGAPFYLLGVELHIPNLAPMRARNIQPVPRAQVPNLALGLQLTCVVDPADPARLFAVDWDATGH